MWHDIEGFPVSQVDNIHAVTLIHALCPMLQDLQQVRKTAPSSDKTMLKFGEHSLVDISE